MSWTIPATAGVAAGAVVLAGCSPGVRSCILSKRISELHKHKLSHDEKEYEKWSSLDLSAWLLQRGVSSEVAMRIQSENIHGDSFLHLRRSHLTELGVSKLGDIMRIESLQKLLGNEELDSSGMCC